MKDLALVYLAQFRTSVAVQLQYRASLVIWLIGLVLEPVVYLVVWSTVARANGGDVGGYGSRDFAAYFISTMIVNHLTFTWIMWEYEYRIRTGTLSAQLLRPIHPIHADIADNIAYKLLTLTVILPVTLLLGIAFQPAYNLEVWSVAAFAGSVVLAFLLRFMVGWVLALAAFWTTRNGAINQIYYTAMLFLSGQLVPVGLLPEQVQAVTWVLPFRWMVAFPVELLIGRVQPMDALIGAGMQIVWLVLIVLLLQALWRAGVRRFSAVGS